jgi:glycosyltransferase involved in cell wall biosynthesis
MTLLRLMHILMIANYPPPYEGGIQFIVAELAERYVAAGHQVTILASTTGMPSTPPERWTLVPVPAFNGLERFSIPYPLFDPIVLTRALDELLPSIDVVHAHGLIYLNCVVGAQMARRRGIPVVVTEYVGTIEYRQAVVTTAEWLAFATLGRLSARSADAIAVSNERVRREVRALARRETPIVKIPTGVDTLRFHPSTHKERLLLRRKWDFTRPTVLFVGRRSHKKGIDRIVAAARQADDIDFALCGKGIETIADLPSNARALGKVDRRTLRELYSAADALLLPSEGEGFPLVVQEAMACGLPVVVTDNETNREYLDETVAVLVRRHPDAIADAVRALLTDPARCEAMSAAARAWAMDKFDWDETVARFLALYRGEAVVEG